MKRLIFNIYRIFFAIPLFYRLNRIFLNLSLRGIGVLNYENDSVSGEKNLIRKILPRLIERPQPIFFDIGAYIGNYTRILHARFPAATIYAFEPNPKNFPELSTLNMQNVKPQFIALGAKEEDKVFYDMKGERTSSQGSFFQEVITHIHNREVIQNTVKVETLDNFTRRQQIDYIDFIKIDTEGYELNILKGATSLLKRKAIGCIQFEFNEMNVYSRSFLQDFRELLADYTLYRLLPRHLLKLDDKPIFTELFTYQNILAIPKNKINLLY
jgi:FkbM family methyltransferase